MMLRRFLALAAIAVAVAACSSGNAGDATADGTGGELQATTWVLNSYASAGTPFAPSSPRACTPTPTSGPSASRGSGAATTTTPSTGTVADPPRRHAHHDPDVVRGGVTPSRPATSRCSSRAFYNVRNETLTIRGADLSILLVFDAAPANPLLGSWIVDGYAPSPNAVSVPLAGTEMTAVFRLRTVADARAVTRTRADTRPTARSPPSDRWRRRRSPAPRMSWPRSRRSWPT